jgi:XisI protein
MATVTTLDNDTLVENILKEYASIPYAVGKVEHHLIIDKPHHRYLLLTLGWEGKKRVHYAVVDVELRAEKIWIHRDGTEDGIAVDLERAGIPKNCIVLAWHPEEVRHLTEYAVK